MNAVGSMPNRIPSAGGSAMKRNDRFGSWTQWGTQILCTVTLISQTALAADVLPELFCSITESSGLRCQYKDKKNSSRAFSDLDVTDFITKSAAGGYITVKSKRGFERTFEVDPSYVQFKKITEKRDSAGTTELARMKLDLFSEMEKKAVQISDGLDTIFVQSDLLKYDPSIAIDKCRLDMKASTSGTAYEKNVESLQAENKALGVFLTGLIKAFKDPTSCLSDFKIHVTSDGSIDLEQLQGLSQAFKNRCKKKVN